MKKELCYYFLSMLLSEGVDLSLLLKLLEAAGGPEAFYELKPEELFRFGLPIPPFVLATYEKLQDEKRILSSWDQMEALGVRYITREDVKFPQRLLNIPKAPFGIFVKGQLPEEPHPAVAIVGARKCSTYGKEMAYSFGRALADQGVTVISGMALGVDGYAMEGALAGGGKTYGILAGGADICYPMENVGLYRQLVDRFGILSERACGTRALPQYFPFRNRLVSGMADAVIVIEAALRSGTSITVDYALEQNKEVFALPGRVGDRLSEGCNLLIKNGAQVLTEPEDILNALGLSGEKEKTSVQKRPAPLSKEEQFVLESLNEAMDLETLLMRTALPVSDLLSVLMSLELKNIVTEENGGIYARSI